MPTVTRGSTDIRLRVQVVTAAGDTVDLTAASQVKVNVRTSRGDRHELTPTWPNNGNDGLIEVAIPDACWRFADWLDWQVWADFAGSRRMSRKGRIVVTMPV